jgi:hypothetical protein
VSYDSQQVLICRSPLDLLAWGVRERAGNERRIRRALSRKDLRPDGVRLLPRAHRGSLLGMYAAMQWPRGTHRLLFNLHEHLRRQLSGSLLRRGLRKVDYVARNAGTG